MLPTHRSKPWLPGLVGLVLATALLAPGRASAQTAPPAVAGERADGAKPATDPVRLGAYVDVPPFVNKGFSGYLTVKPRALRRWELGVGVFQFDQPSGYVSFLNSANAGFGDKALVATALANYYFGWDPIPHFGTTDTDARGLFAGGYLGYWRQTLSLPSSGAPDASSDHLFVALQAGYQWFPFGKVFYLAPSAGAALVPKLGGNEVVGGRGFQDPVVTPIFFVAAGFELGV